MYGDYPFSILQVYDHNNPKNYGTGFVVHIEPAGEKYRTFVLTCAHVVNPIDPENLRVDGAKAKRVDRNGSNDVDLAVLRVILDRFEVVARLHELLCEGETGKVYGCTGERKEDKYSVMPVKVDVTKFFTVRSSQACDPASLAQISVAAIEKNRILGGFSGGPVVIGDSVRAVLCLKSDVLEGETSTNVGIESHYKPGKLGAAIPIDRLAEVWPDMPTAVREQFDCPPNKQQLVKDLLSCESVVAPETARRVFDVAASELRSWPGRAAGDSFAGCVQLLGVLDGHECEDRCYEFLAEYVHRVADELVDSVVAKKLRKLLSEAGFDDRVLPACESTRASGGYRETLVVRILPDVNKIRESDRSGHPLRLLPYLYQQQLGPCNAACHEAECRARPAPGSERLIYLASHAVETSSKNLIDDLSNAFPSLFAKFAGDVPDRIEHYLPRDHAASALNPGIDRVHFHLPYQDPKEPKEPLNAWSVVCHHIDERLEDDAERAKLVARLAGCGGTIKLKMRAGSLNQMAKRNQRYDSVVISDERASQVLHYLRDRVSLLCARFHSPESLQNLSHALRTPIPFVLLARSPKAVATLDKLLKKTHCLRQLPEMLKREIVANEPGADEVAVIADLPDCRFRFDRAEQELFPNEHL